MTWVPTTMEHIRSIQLRSEQISEDIRPALENVSAEAEKVLAATARTMLTVSGEPVAAFGVVPLNPGVLGTWGAVGEKALRHRLELARGVRACLYEAKATFNCHRMQATVKSDMPHLKDWMEFLEMEYEGRMRQYGADRADYDLYARIFP